MPLTLHNKTVFLNTSSISQAALDVLLLSDSLMDYKPSLPTAATAK